MSSASKFDANLYNLVAQAPVAMTLLTGNTFIIEIANDLALEQWGKKKEDVLNKTVFEAFPELVEQGFEAILEHIYQTGESFKANEMELVLIRHGSPEKRIINFTYQAIKDSDNHIIGIVGVGIDVTDLVNSKKKIKESEEKYKSLFTSMDQGFCIVEVLFDANNEATDYKFLEVNPLFEAHSGISAAEGKTITELVPNIEKRWIEIYGNVAKTGKALRFTEGSDALERWFDAHAFKIGGETGNKVAILFSDITGRKKAEIRLRESEFRFRDLADQSPIIIFIIEPNEDATISYWNKAWLEYTGQTFEQALGRAWDGIVHPDDVKEVLDIYVPAFNNKEPYYIPAIRLKRFDNTYRWHMFKANPRYLESKFIGYVGVGFDIHDRKLAELERETFSQKLEALVETRTQELQRSNEDLQRFAHVASHDLKEPVRKIGIYAQMIRAEKSLPDNVKIIGKLEKIEQSAERLSKVIDGVLSYSSLSNEDAELKPVDLNKLFAEIKADLELLISEKKAEITASHLPVIEGAAVLLHQLFYNLIYNSLKFSKKDTPPLVRVEASIHREQKPEHVIIKITDNGIGFEENYAEKIFETFARLYSKDVYEGTGLGLSLCRKIVERHRGTITASGQPDIGAQFTITLPLRQPDNFV